jgi:hypothetical protein
MSKPTRRPKPPAASHERANDPDSTRRDSNAKPPPRSRRRRLANPPPADFWRAPTLADAAPTITPAADATAVMRSLGPPPLTGFGHQAEQSIAAVILRAASLATALAAAAEILEAPGDN